MADPTQLYEFHGIPLSAVGTQARGTCPFCGGKFEVNLERKRRKNKMIDAGVFDCWGCDHRGNSYSFIEQFHSHCLGLTKEWDSLAEDRKIEAAYLREAQLAKNPITGEWLIPVFGFDSKIKNLYVWRRLEGRRRLMSSPSFSHQLYLAERFHRKSDRLLWLVEGHWDALSMVQITHKLDLPVDILGCPGSNIFRREWLDPLTGRPVNMVFDNDEPGEIGIDRVVGFMADSGSRWEAKRMNWGGVKKYNDIRDLLATGQHPRKIYNSMVRRMESTETGEGDPEKFVERTKFEQLVEDFSESGIVVNTEFRRCLAVCLATIISTKFKGDPLWVYIVGPPSSGKSTLCEALSCSDRFVKPISDITAAGFVSGVSKDRSWVLKCDERTVVTKDFTTILSRSDGERERLYGILRDCYDGVYRAKSGLQEEEVQYKVHFSIIAGVTTDIRAINHSTVGERFLHCDISGQGSKQAVMDAMRNMAAIDKMEEAILSNGEFIDEKDFMRERILGYLNHLEAKIDESGAPRVPVRYKNKISSLAELCSILRSRTRRDFKGSLLIKPSRESGSRLSKQFTKLMMSLAVVFDTPIGSDIYSMTKDVAFSTVSGFVFDLVKGLTTESPMSIQRMEQRMHMSSGLIQKTLNEMRDLGMLIRRKGTRPKYELSQELRKHWDTIMED